MADFKTHVTTSSVLGIGVGAGASLVAGFTPVQGALVGCLTGAAGMLPDLDSQSGRPVREIFGVTAALAPLVMLERLRQWGGDNDATMLLAILMYVSIRYGAGAVLSLVAVHRGMFHSIPAMIIAAELAFLGYASPSISTKLLMAFGVAAGFLSHLVLDEVYSVELSGLAVKLKSSAGTAVKFFGNSIPANIFTYGLAFTLGYGVMIDGGLWNSIQDDVRAGDWRSAQGTGENGGQSNATDANGARTATGRDFVDKNNAGVSGSGRDYRGTNNGGLNAGGSSNRGPNNGVRDSLSNTGNSRRTNSGTLGRNENAGRRSSGSGFFNGQDDEPDSDERSNAGRAGGTSGGNRSSGNPGGRDSAVGATDRRVPR